MRGFELVTHLPVPVRAVFDASLSIDAHLGSMRFSRERAIAGVTSGTIGLGQSVTWRAWHGGVPFTMTSIISELEEPRRFVDEQVAGPFGAFRHEHLFEPAGGGTRMVDRLRLASPVAGFVVEPVLLVPYVRHLIRVRNRFLLRSLLAG